MSTRRGFLGGLAGIFAASMAPAAIGSGVLMPVREIIKPQEMAKPQAIWLGDSIAQGNPEIMPVSEYGQLLLGDVFTIAGDHRLYTVTEVINDSYMLSHKTASGKKINVSGRSLLLKPKQYGPARGRWG